VVGNQGDDRQVRNSIFRTGQYLASTAVVVVVIATTLKHYIRIEPELITRIEIFDEFVISVQGFGAIFLAGVEMG
jgi:hypothetical protein